MSKPVDQNLRVHKQQQFINVTEGTEGTKRLKTHEKEYKVRWISYGNLNTDQDFKVIAKSIRQINELIEVSSGAKRTWTKHNNSIINPWKVDPEKHGIYIVEETGIDDENTNVNLQFPAYAKLKQNWDGNPKLVYLSFIAVDPGNNKRKGARGQGHARKIFKQVFEDHPKKVITFDVRNNEEKKSSQRAIRFYNKLSSDYIVRYRDTGDTYINGDSKREYFIAKDEKTLRDMLGEKFDTMKDASEVKE